MSTTIPCLALLLVAAQANAQCAVLPEPAAKSVAATIAGQTITLTAVDAEIEEALCQARMAHGAKLAELREQALERIIDARLLAAEAEARKLASAEALIQKTIEPVPPPAEATIRTMYEESKSQLEGQTFEQVKPRIVAFLTEQAQRVAVAALVDQLRAKHDVRIKLAPFRVPVPPGGVSRGPADAPIHIVEFADFECGFCGRVLPTIRAVQAKYGDKIRWTFRDFPLAFHPRAVPAAIAARCAGKQGKYWPMHDLLFANTTALGDAALTGYAKSLGLDEVAFGKCQADPAVARAVEADHAVGRRLGVSGTPAFFINGELITGAQPIDAFSRIIDRELGRR